MKLKFNEFNKLSEVYKECREKHYSVMFIITCADKDKNEAEDVAPLTELGIQECKKLGEEIKGDYGRYRTSGIVSTDQTVEEIGKSRDKPLELRLVNEMTKITWNKNIIHVPKPKKMKELEETYFISDVQEWYKEFSTSNKDIKNIILSYCKEPEKYTICYKDIYSTSSIIYEKLKEEMNEIDIMFAISNELIIGPLMSVFCPEFDLQKKWLPHLSGFAIINTNKDELFVPVTGI